MKRNLKLVLVGLLFSLLSACATVQIEEPSLEFTADYPCSEAIFVGIQDKRGVVEATAKTHTINTPSSYNSYSGTYSGGSSVSLDTGSTLGSQEVKLICDEVGGYLKAMNVQDDHALFVDDFSKEAVAEYCKDVPARFVLFGTLDSIKFESDADAMQYAYGMMGAYTLGIGWAFAPAYKFSGSYAANGNLYIFDKDAKRIVWGSPISYSFKHVQNGVTDTDNVESAVVPYGKHNLSVEIAEKFEEGLKTVMGREQTASVQ